MLHILQHKLWMFLALSKELGAWNFFEKFNFTSSFLNGPFMQEIPILSHNIMHQTSPGKKFKCNQEFNMNERVFFPQKRK